MEAKGPTAPSAQLGSILTADLALGGGDGHVRHVSVLTNELLLYSIISMSYYAGSRLREIRVLNRLSISDACRRTGVSRAQISLIENGKADPRLSTVEKLLSSYGASLADLEPVRVRVPTIDEVSERAQQAASRLYEVGLGPSDPLARLDLKRSRGANTESERQALATRP